MVPLIVSQSRESSIEAPEGFLIESRQADIEFFLKRGIQLPDVTASVTGTPAPGGDKFTGTPVGAESPTDSQADHFPPDVEHDDP